jgi:maltoporin
MNTFSFGYGDGVVAGLKLSNPDSANEDAKTYRFVNNYDIKHSENLDLQFSLVHEQKDNGASDNSLVTWSSIGLRPIYFINDHYSIATEFGHSEVHDESDGNGIRTLSRLTIAPQISMTKAYYGRPVLRAFYTMSFWNDPNKTLIATKAPSYLDKNEGGSYGLQAEVWF